MATQVNHSAIRRSDRDHDHDTSGLEDIFQLQGMDHCAIGFIKPSDVVAFHAANYGKDLPYAGVHGGHWYKDADHSGDRDVDYAGRPETFQQNKVGTFTYSSFPAGWSDPALADPNSLAPQPSAVVIETTGADGHPTKALATLPAVAGGQGIYRTIDPADYYATRADVRIDQFGDTDPSGAVGDPNNPGFFTCGCPLALANSLDWAMQVSFLNLDGVTDPTHAPSLGVVASSQTHTWHLFAVTANIAADVDLGLTVEEGKWYGIETDFTASNGALHGAITDAATGAILADRTVFLSDSQYGAYDSSVDGVFDAEAFFDGELTLVFGTDPNLNKPGLAVVDNIDVPGRHEFSSHGGYGLGGWSFEG